MELTEGIYRGKNIRNKRERLILQIMMECMKNQNQYQDWESQWRFHSLLFILQWEECLKDTTISSSKKGFQICHRRKSIHHLKQPWLDYRLDE